jgi:hypothetical protein
VRENKLTPGATPGKQKTGKAYLYIKRLSDVQLPVLEQLFVRFVVETQRRCKPGR